MNFARIALCTAFAAASIVAVGTWARPSFAQERGQAVAKSADGKYVGTDVDGNYQKALEAAITKAKAALSNGGQVSDLQINWTVFSVGGTSGGITGKTNISVTIHVTA